MIRRPAEFGRNLFQTALPGEPPVTTCIRIALAIRPRQTRSISLGSHPGGSNRGRVCTIHGDALLTGRQAVPACSLGSIVAAEGKAGRFTYLCKPFFPTIFNPGTTDVPCDAVECPSPHEYPFDTRLPNHPSKRTAAGSFSGKTYGRSWRPMPRSAAFAVVI